MHSLNSSRVINRKLHAGLVAAFALLPAAGGAAWAQNTTARVALPYDQAQVDKELANARFLGHQSPQTPVNLVVMLPLRNQDQLKSLLDDLYNPSSPRYRHYLTPQQLADQFGASQSDYDAVVKYAEAEGFTVTNASKNRTLIDIRGNTDAVENAFGVRIDRYLMPDGRVSFATQGIPSIPSVIRSKLIGVTGFSNLNVWHHHHTIVNPLTKALRPIGSKAGTGELGGFSPHDIVTAYNVPTNMNGQGQTVALYELDSYVQSDITTYTSTYGLPAPNLVPILIDTYNGTVQDPNSESEVVLDIDMVASIAPGLKSIEVYEALNQDPDALDEWSKIEEDNTASVVSTSWGIPESWLTPGASGQQPPEAVAENQIFSLMKAQGQTIYDASGDSGAFDDPNKPTTPEVDDPAGDPLVMAVGGTTLNIDPTSSAWSSEAAWSDSGGGVSTIWPKPSYQTGVQGSTAAAGSVTNREVPDVSLNADVNTPYDIYQADQGGWFEVGGTSAAAPLWAGFTSLVNQQLANLGSNPIGFINPAIYKIGQNSANYAAGFHDIVTGGNGVASFAAHKGFDDTTGWGTFNAAQLIPLLAVPQNSVTGTISGVVSDVSGPVVGATVTAHFSNGQVAATTTTGTGGTYTLPVQAGVAFLVTATNTIAATTTTPAIPEVAPNVNVTLQVSNGQAVNATNINFQLIASHSFPTGLQMISVPYEYTGIADFATVMGLAHDPPINGVDPLLYSWQSSTFNYVSTPTVPADTFHLGAGYWTDLNPVSQGSTVGGTLQLLGTPAPTTQPFQIVLSQGWNMIGDPFTQSISASTFQVSNLDGSNKVPIAGSAQLNPPTTTPPPGIFYTYDQSTGNYDPVQVSGTLNAYAGYWVYAYQSCILIMQPPA